MCALLRAVSRQGCGAVGRLRVEMPLIVSSVVVAVPVTVFICVCRGASWLLSGPWVSSAFTVASCVFASCALVDGNGVCALCLCRQAPCRYKKGQGLGRESRGVSRSSTQNNDYGAIHPCRSRWGTRLPQYTRKKCRVNTHAIESKNYASHPYSPKQLHSFKLLLQSLILLHYQAPLTRRRRIHPRERRSRLS
jgi:hypothetical protein